MRIGKAFVLLVALRVPAAASPADFTRFLGGGPRATDCLLVEDVAGVAGGGKGQAARCTDGDPACDADGVANGACAFRVRLCLDADPGPECLADVITQTTVTPANQSLAPLASALAALSMPVGMPDTCTAPATVSVVTRGRRSRRVALRAAGITVSETRDRDRLVLVCRSAQGGSAAAFAKVERAIFKASCTSTSCHGAAAAGGLSLEAGGAYANLVGVPPVNPAARAAGVLRVMPGHPEESFLVAKLEGHLGPDEGRLMPWGGPALSPKKIDLVRRWIAAAGPIASDDGSTPPPAHARSAQ